jgi:hypothetical protein
MLVASNNSIAEQRAQASNLPAKLFDFTPSQKEYWFEPSLPQWLPEMRDNPPLGYHGLSIMPLIGYITSNQMGPRFPEGCGVMLAPVCECKNLVIGKVYTYNQRNAKSGEWEMTIGRLVEIGSNYLVVAADNPSPGRAKHTIWPLRDKEQEAVWDVREVTHYVSYPW